MAHLYFWLNIASVGVPFLFSFHPKLKFYKYWKFLFPSIAIMMAIFIPWDIIFTKNGFWGFNENYLLGSKLFGLPLEEWLFFICIPYACLFTHYSLQYFFPKFKLSVKAVDVIYIMLQTVLIATLLYNYNRWYTAVNFAYAILLLGLVYNYDKNILQVFLPSFLVILIPFFLVNGVLTGSWIEDEVVWYNNSENLGIRIGTVPIEDSIYALGMLLSVFALMEYFSRKKRI
ncbi:lycopene cyclase domain-containing protein [Aequorivita echinoideorum]|uniref:Lycopene cyclase domain-containing protein n=1 Tax=Aequorivita echinoideorum TaxID=1549647 RepID=A0ABS5S998_9FLAO|nr:lycopene cyclase domain-containing protein [Aequorivita echinoideorum]